MRVFARIDHALLAADIEIALKPTELLIFGNPHAGTSFMQANQTIGIDLPLKALVWQDEKGNTWLTCNDPGWLAQRHGIRVETSSVVTVMVALAVIAEKATAYTGAPVRHETGLQTPLSRDPKQNHQ